MLAGASISKPSPLLTSLGTFLFRTRKYRSPSLPQGIAQYRFCGAVPSFPVILRSGATKNLFFQILRYAQNDERKILRLRSG